MLSQQAISFKESLSFVLKYLNDQDKLSLRKINKECCELIKKNQKAPYQNKEQFVMAFTGKYKFIAFGNIKFNDEMLRLEYMSYDYLEDDQEKQEFLIEISSMPEYKPYTQNALKSAYACYINTIQSGSDKPAMLYKLRDFKIILELPQFISFKKNEDLHKKQRQYSPQNHNWDVNSAWVLAQIHKGRSFTLFSELDGESLFRKSKQSKESHSKPYSAFAREVACILKSGYKIDISNEEIHLIPDSNKNYLDCTIDDIQVPDEEIGLYLKFLSKI